MGRDGIGTKPSPRTSRSLLSGRRMHMIRDASHRFTTRKQPIHFSDPVCLPSPCQLRMGTTRTWAGPTTNTAKMSNARDPGIHRNALNPRVALMGVAKGSDCFSTQHYFFFVSCSFLRFSGFYIIGAACILDLI